MIGFYVGFFVMMGLSIYQTHTALKRCNDLKKNSVIILDSTNANCRPELCEVLRKPRKP